MKTIFNDEIEHKYALIRIGDAYEKNRIDIDINASQLQYIGYLNYIRSETGYGLYDSWTLLKEYINQRENIKGILRHKKNGH